MGYSMMNSPVGSAEMENLQQPFGYAPRYFTTKEEELECEYERQRRRHPFIDDEAVEDDGEMELDVISEDGVQEADPDHMAEIEEAERLNTLMTAAAAEDAGAQPNPLGELDDEFPDSWEPVNLRDPVEAGRFGNELENTTSNIIPPPEINEYALFHLGELDFMHIYETPEQEHGLKIELRQWLFDDETHRSGYRLSSHGITLTWDEWKRFLSVRSKVLDLVFRVVQDRFVDEKFQLGTGDKFVSITHPFWVVNVRGWFQKSKGGPYYPGRRGMSLKFKHYRRLLRTAQAVEAIREILAERKAQYDKTMQEKKEEARRLAKVTVENMMKQKQSTYVPRPDMLQKVQEPKVKTEQQKAREAARVSLKEQLQRNGGVWMQKSQEKKYTGTTSQVEKLQVEKTVAASEKEEENDEEVPKSRLRKRKQQTKTEGPLHKRRKMTSGYESDNEMEMQ